MPRNSSTGRPRSISRGENAARAVMLLLASWALSPAYAGAAEQGWLGLTVQPLTQEIAVGLGLPRAQGALVSDVDAHGPAARVGLKPGDVVLAVDGRPISNEDDLLDRIGWSEPGTTMTLEVFRNGRHETLALQMTAVPDASALLPVPAWSPNARWGIVVEPLTSVMADVLAMPSASKGVVVTAVDPHGAGAASGLETVDVIEQVNGHSVGSATELRFALQHATSKPALLFIDRNGLTMFLTMRTDQP